MLNFLKNNLKPQIGKAVVYFTNNKIVIFTMDTTNESSSVLSKNLSILDIDCGYEIIAEKILHHASLSKILDNKIINLVNYYKDVLKLAGFKTMKAANENTKYISFEKSGDKISICPYTNIDASKKSQYYLRQPDDLVEINQPITNEGLGKLIADLKNKCNFRNY